MNCTYCYAHLKKKKPSPGCRISDEGKPERCRKYKMIDCARERNVLFCSECSDYPCILIKRMDKSYQTRYRESLINNMRVISEKGMDYYLRFEEKRLKCPECCGILSFHGKQCQDCGKIFKVIELE